MFTGIIEEMGEIVSINKENSNVLFGIRSGFTSELKIDQSVCHNGVCLTVVKKDGDIYFVTAIDETLKRSNLGELAVGSAVNLERGLKVGDRLDGHIVQGHVDQTAECIDVQDVSGSWVYSFKFDPSSGNVNIPKGSITVNGVSLTVVESEVDRFSVAIIPYTYNHTNFKDIVKGSVVNLEFDVIGKYVARLNNSN